MSLFPINSQQWFNTDCIETIDDYGDGIMVRLKSGREMRVHSSDRDTFFDAVKGQMVGKRGLSDEEMMRMLSN
ncbi:hypothetical protein [Rhizobium laguerreae]|uniref:Uncharacterized protein n=1 Tax=Rhizobium laguerreae TaxID=1076926 RepID=A0A7Y2RBM0_9HYPH|nr:hypothetical protein [Rhizobium laguerreae]NNH67841.1 hypothetical protein [Rhizobium laguerreae]